MEIKHKTVALDIKIGKNPDERAKMIDTEMNKFLDETLKSLMQKNYTRLEIFEKSTEIYYYEISGMRRVVYLISFFYKIS